MTYHSQNWWGVPRNMSKESRNPTTPRVKYILCWSCCWGDSSSSFRRHSTIAWYLLASDSDWRCIFPSIRLDCGYRPVHASSRPKTRNYRVVVDRATTCVLHIQYLRCTNGEQSKQNNKHERAKFLTRFVNCAFATLLDAHRLRTGWLPGQKQICCVLGMIVVLPTLHMYSHKVQYGISQPETESWNLSWISSFRNRLALWTGLCTIMTITVKDIALQGYMKLQYGPVSPR